MLLSGMSTIVVTPPAAAARVALAKPSQSVRPGSLTWTWVSTSPGSSTSSSASTTTSAPLGVGVVRTDGDDDPVAEPDGDGPLGTVDDRAAGPHEGLRRGLLGHAQLPR